MVNDNCFFLCLEMDNRGQRATLSVSIILGVFNWPSPVSVPKRENPWQSTGTVGPWHSPPPKKASGWLKGVFVFGIENREGYTVYSVLLFGRIYDQSDL